MRERLEGAKHATVHSGIYARPSRFAHLSPQNKFIDVEGQQVEMNQNELSVKDSLALQQNDGSKKFSPLQLLLQLKQRGSDVKTHPNCQVSELATER